MLEDTALEQAAQGFFEGCAVPALLPQALDRLARAIGSRGAMLATPVLTPAMMPISPGLNESSHAFFEEGWYLDAARTKRGARWVSSHPPGFLRDQDLFDADELDSLPYYRDFARKHDVPWFSAGLLHSDRGHYVALSFNRRAREGAFTAEQIGRLNRILPRLQQAGSLLTETTRAHASGMLASFDLMSTPAFLIDRQQRVCGINSAGEALIGPDIMLRRGHLTVAAHKTQCEIDDLLGWAVASSGRPQRETWPVSIATPLSTTAFMLHALPIEGVGHDVFRQGVAVVVINRIDAARPIPAALLRRLFKLTPREAEIAALLADGHSPGSISDQLGLSAETVRFYVKIILEKSQCRRQVEFVRRVSRLTALGGSTLR